MRIPRNIRDNLRFLIAEVGSQVSSLRTCLDTPSVSVARRILDRSGYAYNLMLRIHDSCHHQAIRAGESGADAASLRAIESIATDLERITYVTDLPVLVDVDTGWGGAFNIARTVRWNGSIEP